MIIRDLICFAFNLLEDLLEHLPGNDYPDNRPGLIRWLCSWVATLAIMTDRDFMASLRRASHQARTGKALSYEEVFRRIN
jgi:hypothetical protein